jgi:predicted TIM-barrel fold metal-dependent hydrolase
LFLCAECHPLLSHFKELTVILAHMAPGTVTERSFPYIQLKYALERIYLCLWPRSVVCE